MLYISAKIEIRYSKVTLIGDVIKESRLLESCAESLYECIFTITRITFLTTEPRVDGNYKFSCTRGKSLLLSVGLMYLPMMVIFFQQHVKILFKTFLFDTEIIAVGYLYNLQFA